MEEYKNIIDFPNYQVSNLGNVKNIKTNKLLKPQLSLTIKYYTVLNYVPELNINTYVIRTVRMAGRKIKRRQIANKGANLLAMISHVSDRTVLYVISMVIVQYNVITDLSM